MRAVMIIALALLTSPGRAQPQLTTVVAVSQCRQQISLLVSAVSAGGTRQTFGWFNLPPNREQMLLLANHNPLEVNPAQPFYIYATLADNSDAWQGSDFRVQWQGQTYNMERKELLTVDGTGPFPVRAIMFVC